MNSVISVFYLNLELIFSHLQLLCCIFQQLFCNNLTIYHKQFQVFLEQKDNYCVDYVIHLDIQDQLLKYNHKYCFYCLNLHQNYQHFYPFKITIRKILTHCPTISIICIKIYDVFTFFFRIINFHVFVISFTKFLRDVRNFFLLILFQQKKYLSMSEISSSFISIIFSLGFNSSDKYLKLLSDKFLTSFKLNSKLEFIAWLL